MSRVLHASAAALLLAVLVSTGCQIPRSGPDRDSAPDARIAFVVHGPDADPFWSVVKKGAEQAGRDLNVKIEYHSAAGRDMDDMVSLINAVVHSKPDGLVVSIPSPPDLELSLKAAMFSGVPVISINSGYQCSKRIGLMTHIGQAEYEAGVRAGERMAKAGVTRALCFNHEVGNIGLDERCRGFAFGMADAGAAADVVALEENSALSFEQQIAAALKSHPEADGVLTLGPQAASAALVELRKLKKLDRIKLATFDLTPTILRAVESGEILFAVDQQQYLQGYLPVVLLTLYKRNLAVPAGDLILTGPAFVTAKEVKRVRALHGQGKR